MRECFSLAGLVAVAAGLCCAAAIPGTMRKPTSVVRADPRTGRLVRTIVVPAPAPARRAQGQATVSPAEAGHVPAPPLQRLTAPPLQSLTAPPLQSLTAPPLQSLTAPPLHNLIDETARRYDVDPLLVHSVINVESHYNPYALSPKGAQGLMQLIPSTARRYGVTNPWDARQNVEGGVRYLKYLNTLFPNEPHLAIAAYNAGEAAVWKYGNTIPPYRETLLYVRKVEQLYGRSRASGRVEKPSPRPAPVGLAAAAPPPKEQYAPIEHYVDSEGRLHIHTRPAAGSATP